MTKFGTYDKIKPKWNKILCVIIDFYTVARIFRRLNMKRSLWLGLYYAVVVVSAFCVFASAETTSYAESATITDDPPVAYGEASVVSVRDTFAWVYSNVYYDEQREHYVLTEDSTYYYGSMWCDTPYWGNFAMEFDYYTGVKSGPGGGADGIRVCFYSDHDTSMQGYGVELDTYQNPGDPYYNHIALVPLLKGETAWTTGHLEYTSLPESEDGNWHHLKIVFEDGICTSYVDGTLKLSREIPCSWTGRIGIGAATGGARNLHAVKNIVITGKEKVVDPSVEDTKMTDFSVTLKDYKTDFPIAGAIVSFDGVQRTTDAMGKVTFAKPTTESTELTVVAAGYNDLTISEYASYQTAASDVIELYSEGETAIVPKTCNGISISTSYAQINNKADLYAEIAVGGVSSAKINSFELRQGGTILAKNTTGEFRLYNSKFTKGVPITAYMQTSDGKIVSKELNIHVVSFSFLPAGFTLNSGAIPIPGDVPLFGGIEFGVEALEKFPDYDVSNHDIKIAYSQTVKDKDLSKLNAGLRKWMNERNRKTPSSKFSLDVGGYVMININHAGVESVTGQVVLTANYSNGFNKTYIVYAVPINVDVRFTLEGELVIDDFGYDFENAKLLFPSFSGTITGGLSAKAGVGIKWLSAGVYGSLELKLGLDILPQFMVDSLIADGELGVYAKAVILGEKKIPIFGGDSEWVLYSKDQADIANALQAFAEEAYDLSDYTVSERIYLAARTVWVDNIVTGILQESTYTNANPDIVANDNVTLMAFIDDNGSADPYNYQQLVYSVYTENGWSTPVPVDENDLNDAEFDIFADNEDVWVVYTEAKRPITADDPMEDYAGLVEVAVARYDASTGTFTDRTVLTDNGGMERIPAITVVNGIPTAVWVENSDNNLFGMSANNTIYISQYTNGVWSVPEAIADDVPAVIHMDAGFLNNTLAIAVITDTNSNFATTEDMTMAVYRDDGSYVTYNADVYESVAFEADTLYWYTDGAIYGTTTYGGEGDVVSDSLFANCAADFDVITSAGDAYLLYRVYHTEGDNGGCDIYAMKQDGDTWAAPIRLTTVDGYVDSFAAMVADGAMHLVYRRTDVTFTEDDFTTVSVLHVEQIVPAVASVITDVSYDYEDLFDDDTVTLFVSVTNKGFETANGFRIGDVTYTETVASGATVTVEYSHTLIADTANATITLTDENGMTDTASVTVGYGDFRVSAEPKTIGGMAYISAVAGNYGNNSGSGTLNIKRDNADGEVLYTKKVTLAPGEQANVLLKILDDSVERVYAEIVSEAEDYFAEDNNTTCAVIRTEDTESAPLLIGDVNNDSWVDVSDACLLFRHSMLPQFYPVPYPLTLDYTNDGYVDIRDAYRLFQYSMMPDIYPLT